ncbi:MAG: C_GCAxxG_C_C family protein [Anaerolineae bacterium]|nr:C_GCAxxG_C_C family protein [Anaerolineae bacterium]
MNLAEQAVAFFEDDHNCAQSVLMAVGPQWGLDAALARRVAAPFGGGIVGQGRTCGAVTGALMAIGLRYGDAPTVEMEAAAAAFLERFRARHTTTVCKELLRLDIGISDELEWAREEGVFATRCTQFVRDAVEILGEL